MAAPSNISFGTVVGRYGRLVIDNDDPDRDPNFIPQVGLIIRFTPSSTVFKNVNAGPPITLVMDSIVATTDEDGYVVGPDGLPGIRLAATDDPDLNPTGWTWRVSITGPSFATINFSFLLPSDEPVDLTTVAPVPSNPGQGLEDWQVAVSQAQAARDDAIAAAQSAVSAVVGKADVAGVPVEAFLLPGESLDPSGVRDMSTIAQRAIDTVDVSASPVQIVWPAGRFRLETQLTARSRVGLRGADRTLTTFLPVGDQCFITGNVVAPWLGTWLDDITFSDFTVDCTLQSYGAYLVALKAFFMQNMRRPRWDRVDTVGSWASMYGCDFLIDAVLSDCTGTNSGRGGPDHVVGTGSTFAFGVGRHAGESITLINCRAYTPGTGGFFFERLEDRGATRQDGVFRIIGGGSQGGKVGVIDCGAGNVKAIGALLEGFTNAGWYIGPGGQSSVGGIKGHIDSSTIIRNGVATGTGDVIGGHGVYIAGDPTAGGYVIEGQIEGNAGAGVYLAPGFGLSPGGLTIRRHKIRGNAGGGVVAYGGARVEPGISVTDGDLAGNMVGLDLRTATRGLRVSGNSFTSTGDDQPTALRFDPSFLVDHPVIQDNTTWDTDALLTGDAGFVDEVVTGNRELNTTAPDPSLVFFSSLVTPTDTSGLGDGWTQAAVGGFNSAVGWTRTSDGARPDGYASAVAVGQYRDVGRSDTRVSASYVPSSTGSQRRRGVMRDYDPATGNSVAFEADPTGMYRLIRRLSGAVATIWTSTIPGTEAHNLGIERDTGTNTFRALIDGTVVWSGTVSSIPETTHVGVEGLAAGYARLRGFTVRVI